MQNIHGKISEVSTIFSNTHCVKSVHNRSYSDPYFPVYGLNMDQNNCECGRFLRSDF